MSSRPPRNVSSEEMISTHLDRRSFLGLSAAAIVGGCLSQAHGESAQDMSVSAEGNAERGYAALLSYQGKPIHSKNSGELSFVFENGERSLHDRIDGWRAKSWSGDNRGLTLIGDAYLESLNATVRIAVVYTVVAPNIVRKRVHVRQSDMFMLYWQLSNELEPADTGVSFWSFDEVDRKPGAIRDYFPAAGYRTQQGLTVGVLSDAGFRNEWSRMYRRDGQPIKPAPNEIPDPNLFAIAPAAEQGRHSIRQTFGEELHQLPPGVAASPIQLPLVGKWRTVGAARITPAPQSVSITVAGANDSVVLPFTAEPAAIYAIHFEYQSTCDVGITICDMDAQFKPLQNFNQFNDRTPASPGQWATFHSTVFVSDIRGSGALVFSLPQDGPVAERKLELRNVKLCRLPSEYRPYHRLEMDKEVERISFIFADPNIPATLRGYRLASQLRLAEALGFRGGETEKVLYADLMMLCWNAGVETPRPMLAPSIYYSAAGEMYLRDSFFSMSGTHNRGLNENIFNLWAENQGEDGAINTLVEPEMTNLERKSNDSTPLWLMWALLNQRRFGIAPPMDKIRKAAEYCLNAYDPKRDGACIAQFVMGQLDIVAYPQGTSVICQNQGLLAVTLRVIRELNIPDVSAGISDQHIGRAEELYRSYYDPVRRFMMPARDIKDAIGFAELFPEYLSLWLFDRKLLTDEMVLNHLDQMPPMLARADCPHPELNGTVRPVFIGLGDHPGEWRWFTERWHPMASDSYALSYANGGMNGIYYNGGSWMRIEVCAYVVGKKHGWKIADKAIENRLWAEINIAPDFPTSQEYLPTDPLHPFFGFHRVFAWNVAVLQAMELAGLRTPEMDPDYRK
jgi:hypothetical protein